MGGALACSTHSSHEATAQRIGACGIAIERNSLHALLPASCTAPQPTQVILVGDDDMVLPAARFKDQCVGHFVLNARDDGLAGDVERVGKLLQRAEANCCSVASPSSVIVKNRRWESRGVAMEWDTVMERALIGCVLHAPLGLHATAVPIVPTTLRCPSRAPRCGCGGRGVALGLPRRATSPWAQRRSVFWGRRSRRAGRRRQP